MSSDRAVGVPGPDDASDLVSVVLPTHDRPARLPGAIRSVLAQTYRRLELIVVDDASSEPVDEVVAAAAGGDERVRLLRLPRNLGASGARNAGIAEARGSVLAFLDDDDRWEPSKLEQQVAYFDRHPDVGLVTCDYVIEREGTGAPPLRFRGPPAFSAEQLLWVNFAGSFSLVALRRSLVGDELHIDETFVAAEDWDLWLRCARHGAAASVLEPLVRQVGHAGPRLTDAEHLEPGLARFAAKHADAMSDACRAFQAAHLDMGAGRGWRKRARVGRALAARDPRASAVLVLEQLARQTGRVRRDPGLTYRVLARAIPSAPRPRVPA
jgi:GT2 family glycosyltransferase